MTPDLEQRIRAGYRVALLDAIRELNSAGVSIALVCGNDLGGDVRYYRKMIETVKTIRHTLQQQLDNIDPRQPL